jgi:hypothetical protein
MAGRWHTGDKMMHAELHPGRHHAIQHHVEFVIGPGACRAWTVIDFNPLVGARFVDASQAPTTPVSTPAQSESTAIVNRDARS